MQVEPEQVLHPRSDSQLPSKLPEEPSIADFFIPTWMEGVPILRVYSGPSYIGF